MNIILTKQTTKEMHSSLYYYRFYFMNYNLCLFVVKKNNKINDFFLNSIKIMNFIYAYNTYFFLRYIFVVISFN